MVPGRKGGGGVKKTPPGEKTPMITVAPLRDRNLQRHVFDNSLYHGSSHENI